MRDVVLGAASMIWRGASTRLDLIYFKGKFNCSTFPPTRFPNDGPG